jgi:hypothetical protein
MRTCRNQCACCACDSGALAHGYAGLETFPIVVRLLPDGLLDEQRIQSLARHVTMARSCS